MIRKILLGGASAMAFSALVSASTADATTINFGAYPLYTPITTVGDATFSLVGGPGYGTPVTGSFGSYALGNSPTGAYPTADILNVSFAAPVSNVTFTFDNFGNNGYFGAPSYAFAFSGATLVGATNLGYEPYGYAFAPGAVAGTGITDVEFYNGSGGNYSWEFGLGEISYTSGVPEASTWALMLGGFGFIGYVLRRRVLRTA